MPDESVVQDALLASMRVQEGASAEGFDWSSVAGVLAKVDEEVQEIREALVDGDVPHARRELGDLLLVVVNLARFVGADPREELKSATQRFENRFAHLKHALAEEGMSVEKCAPEELERWWQRIKPRADELLSKGS